MTTIAILIGQSGGNWDHAAWKTRLQEALPNHKVLLPADGIEPTTVDYACVWKPPAHALTKMTNLKAIFNFGAGVDALLNDSTLPPDVPIVRAVNDNLTTRMSEYVLLHVLRYHRQWDLHVEAQRAHEWISPNQWAAKDLRIGVLGTGVLGEDAMRKLKAVGFDVAGWGRSRKALDGLTLYAGEGELDAFLARTDILVALLPSTPETKGILNRSLFTRLAKNGRLGGPIIINCGRGALQNEADIIACLDDGTLKAATLDVFIEEPLPKTHPLWTHPRVTVTPHNSADSEPDAIAAQIANQIKAFENGAPLANIVNRATGY